MFKKALLKRLKARLWFPRRRFVIVAGSFILYFIAYGLLYPVFGLHLITIGIIPIIIGAWLYGMWTGGIFVLALYIFDTLFVIFFRRGDLSTAFSPEEMLNFMSSLTASLVIGRLGEINLKKQREMSQQTLLLEEVQQRVRELAGLHNISRAISLYGNTSRTFSQLTETLASLLGVKMCVICLYDDAGNELHPQSPAYGLGKNVLPAIHYSSVMDENIWNFSELGVFRANCESEIPAEFIPLARSLGVDCVLAIPLWNLERRLIGAIFAANKPNGFTSSDIQMLEIVIDQVTAVIKNAHVMNTERARAEQLAVLHAVAIAATEADDEDQLIERVTSIIGERLYSDSFGILLLDESSQELCLHSSYKIGFYEGPTRVPLGVGIAGTVGRSGKPCRVDDLSSSPVYLSLYPLARSALCIPLKVEEKLLGVVNAESASTAAFTKEDENLLTIIAGQLATAIQRLRTVQAERYQTRQLERSNSLIRALAEVNTRASSAYDPDGVLNTLGNELAKLGMRCAIALLDAPGQNVIFRYVSLPGRLLHALEYVGKIKLQDYVIPITQLSPYSGLSQNPYLVEDPLSQMVSWAPGFPQKTALRILELVGVTETTSVCYLPLITEGKPIGVLWMWGEGLHENDLPAVSLFASQVAAALQNASLLAEVGRLAITDDLTGIANRRHFFEIAEKDFAQAQRYKKSLSVLIVDIDRFKQFNDTYGHAVGDQILRGITQLMSAAMRECDLLGRYGGEEFSIILPETNLKDAIHVAERLIAQISNTPIETEAGQLTVQLSIGVAELGKETPDLHSLIIRADRAMYEAKKAGRNRVAAM